MSIFISIASYEDPFLIDTVKSAFTNAKNPDGLYFGVCAQYKIIEEPDLSFLPEDQIKIIRYDPETRPGLYRIRAEIASLYTDQDYFFQIDSHTMFMQDWDEILIQEYKECQKYAGHDKIIFSSMFEFNLSDNRKLRRISTIKCNSKDLDNKDVGILFLLSEDFKFKGENRKFLPNPSMQVGSLFCTGNYLAEVPYNKYMQFVGEQIYQSFATFLCGWDSYQPLIIPIHHDNKDYKQILKEKNIPFTYQSNNIVNTTLNLIFLNLAFLYNDYSIYKVKNAVRKPIDFWSYCGLEKEYKERLEIVDKILNSESLPSIAPFMGNFPNAKWMGE